jgi:hypothetical protein
MIDPPPSALDRIASAWERIATVLERIELCHLPIFERPHMTPDEWTRHRAAIVDMLDESGAIADDDGSDIDDDADDDER